MLDIILENYPDIDWLKADGFDSAIIGTYENKLVYSRKLCIEILLKQSMDYNEAVEFFDFNVTGSYMGDKTPIFIYDDYE